MVQKYISMIVVLLLLGFTMPAFAGDYVNPNLLPNRLPLTASVSSSLAGRVTLTPGLAFAPPQAGQSQQTPAPQNPPVKGKGGGSKVYKVVGIVMMGAGSALIARGAVLSDPCKGLNGPYVLCTSNYTTVRAASFGVGGGLAGGGLILFLHGRHAD
jgi:hypothetical protein